MPETEPKFSPSFVINKNKNLTNDYERAPEVDQIPFFLNSIGPATLRERNQAYKVEK